MPLMWTKWEQTSKVNCHRDKCFYQLTTAAVTLFPTDSFIRNREKNLIQSNEEDFLTGLTSPSLKENLCQGNMTSQANRTSLSKMSHFWKML